LHTLSKARAKVFHCPQVDFISGLETLWPCRHTQGISKPTGEEPMWSRPQKWT